METREIVVVVVVVVLIVVASCWSGGADLRRTVGVVVCGLTTKYAKRTRTRTVTCIRTCGVPGRDIVYLKCGRRSRLLPIHLAQDGRQIELPPETQDQRALAQPLPFLPSFLPAPRHATFLPFPYLSQSPSLSSVLFFTLLLLAAVIGFFLYSVGQYNRFLAVEDTLASRLLVRRTGKETGEGWRKRNEKGKRERERENFLSSTVAR